MLRIFLYSLIIIGCFSNFARNEWGFQLRAIAELLLGLSFLYEFGYAMKKKNLNFSKKERIFHQIQRFCIAFFFLAFVFKTIHWPGSGLMYVVSIAILVIILAIRSSSLYLSQVNSKTKKITFWILLLTSFAIFDWLQFNEIKNDFDGLEWIALILTSITSYLLSSFLILLLLRLMDLVILRNKVSAQNFILNLIMISAAFMASGVLFKVMHWPFGQILILIGIFFFVISIIVGLLVKVEFEGKRKNLIVYFSHKFPYEKFTYFYFGVWSIFILLSVLNIAPRFNSASLPYIHQKLLENNEGEKADQIFMNYEELMEEIRKRQEAADS